MATPSLSEIDLDAINYWRGAICPHTLIVIQTARDVFVCAYRDDGPDLCGIRDRASCEQAGAWIDQASAAGLAIERHNAMDLGPDGKPQTVAQGCARASGAEIAQRLAKMPLKAKAIQRPCDVGLFSDDAAQLDLCEMFQDSTEED